MRNTKTHSKTLKKKLNKCRGVFYAYNDIQFRYGEVLDKRNDIVEIRCNVKLDGFILGDNYTTDFYCIKDNNEIMIRECVYQNSLFKPINIKMLDSSREYWLSKGVKDWGIVLDEQK